MSAVGGGRDPLNFPRGGSPLSVDAVVLGLPRAWAIEGGPPENSLNEGCVCCHEGFVRCWKREAAVR